MEEVHASVVDGVTPRIYIDLKTTMLPQEECRRIFAAPPTVRSHEYGAWVHVMPAEAEWGQDDLNPEVYPEWEEFPYLRAVLLKAREMGADWVNFDADGHDSFASLPSFDW